MAPAPAPTTREGDRAVAITDHEAATTAPCPPRSSAPTACFVSGSNEGTARIVSSASSDEHYGLVKPEPRRVPAHEVARPPRHSIFRGFLYKSRHYA